MEPTVNNPHDRYFRTVFSNHKDARIFMEHFLPPDVVKQLNLAQLRLESGSYIDEKLREHLTDMLYSVPLRSGAEASIYCLFEHKSYPEPTVHLQILRYSYERWQMDSRAKADWRPIIAVVFYHGKQKWKTPAQFQDCFKNVNSLFEKYIPNFEYVLVDTSRYDDELLRQIHSGSLQSSLFLLKYIYDERLGNHLNDVIQPLVDVSQEEVLDLLWSILTYIASATDTVNESDLQSTVTDVFQDSEDMIMTLAEKWRLEGEEIGIRKGEEIGIRKGKEIGKQNTIKQIINSRFGEPAKKIIKLIEDCHADHLDEAVDAALEAKNLDELVDKLSKLTDPQEQSSTDG